jgi:hypothetical protein
MTDISELTRINKTQATLHLFKKLKYDLAIFICSKLMQLIKNSKDKVVFNVGGEQRAFPTTLVRTFTNIKSNHVSLNDKYDIQEIMNLFDILLNLSDYKCNGLTQDYADWKPIASLVNMTELAKGFGMEEVESFLKRLPEFFTFQNKNAYENEVQRRLNESKKIEKESQSLPSSVDRRPNDKNSIQFDKENDKKHRRSRSRAKSFTKTISRSLSRGRKERR